MAKALAVFICAPNNKDQGYLIYPLGEEGQRSTFLDTTGLDLSGSRAKLFREFPEAIAPTHRIRVAAAEFTDARKNYAHHIPEWRLDTTGGEVPYIFRESAI